MAAVSRPGARPSGYEQLKARHRQAYDHLSRALEIDESGKGDKSEAIDFYSKGVAELEKGIAMSLNVTGLYMVEEEGEEEEEGEGGGGGVEGGRRERCEHGIGRERREERPKQRGGGGTGRKKEEKPEKRGSYILYGLLIEEDKDGGNISGEEQAKVENLRERMVSNLDMAKDRVSVLLNGGQLKGSKGGKIVLKPTDSICVKPREPLKRTSPPLRPAIPHKVKKTDTPHHPSSHPSLPSSMSHLKGVDSKLADKLLDELLEKDTHIQWSDIVGLELPKQTLQEIVILPVINPELFTGLRAPARGLLLFGPPGNGKTMLAKAVAHESDARFFNVSASSLTSKWVGEGEKLVRALFALARELQPSIIFLDECDALLSRRSEGDNDAMRRLKNEFLQSFDGVTSEAGEKILVMAATNRPHELDDAALRRFEKRIYIPLPGDKARRSVLHKLVSKHNHKLSEQELKQLAMDADGYSFSDITALAKDASLGPIRGMDFNTLKSMSANKVRPINFEDFQNSMKLVRPSTSIDLIRTLEKWNSMFGVSSS